MRPPLAGAGTLGARSLACKRGRRLLFRGLDLQLAPGSITWLRGRNGSGKTSLLRILAGLSAPSEGDITWNGAPVAQADAAARQAIVYIGHANALKDDLTLAEAVAFLARLQAVGDATQRAQVALDRLGLASRRDAPAMRRPRRRGCARWTAAARSALPRWPISTCRPCRRARVVARCRSASSVPPRPVAVPSTTPRRPRRAISRAARRVR